MRVTKEQISHWIQDYVNRCGTNVHNRNWEKKYIRGHAPYNINGCYHEWLDWVVTKEAQLKAMPTFEDILTELNKKKMKGIGPLTRYDTATMLAFPQGKFPQKVYLHAGTARGAKALDVVASAVDKQVFVNICKDFDKLSTAQIEDFLCVYSSYLTQDSVGIEKFNKKIKKSCCGDPHNIGCMHNYLSPQSENFRRNG